MKKKKEKRESFMSFFSGLNMKDERKSTELYCKKYNVKKDVIIKEFKSDIKLNEHKPQGNN